MEEHIRSGKHDIQLEHMSLSGITERFGELGLRRRYEMEIASFSLEDRELCMQALHDVTYLFRNDTYKSHPYTTHLLRTPIRLMRDYQIFDHEMIVSMTYHDGPEDHPKDLVILSNIVPPENLTDQEAALWVLGKRYTPRVRELVGSVTNPEHAGPLTPSEKRQNYVDTVTHKIASSTETFFLKLSDFTENGIGLLWTDQPERLPHFAQKYYPLFDVFLNQLEIYHKQNEVTHKQYEKAYSQLMVGKVRCQKILEKLRLFPIVEV